MELWDRYLWLYGVLLDSLGKAITDKSDENISMYIIENKEGYATAVTSHVLAEGLKESKVCTWTESADNKASNRVAEKLGMEHYYSNIIYERKEL